MNHPTSTCGHPCAGASPHDYACNPHSTSLLRGQVKQSPVPHHQSIGDLKYSTLQCGPSKLCSEAAAFSWPMPASLALRVMSHTPARGLSGHELAAQRRQLISSSQILEATSSGSVTATKLVGTALSKTRKALRHTASFCSTAVLWCHLLAPSHSIHPLYPVASLSLTCISPFALCSVPDGRPADCSWLVCFFSGECCVLPACLIAPALACTCFIIASACVIAPQLALAPGYSSFDSSVNCFWSQRSRSASDIVFLDLA